MSWLISTKKYVPLNITVPLWISTNQYLSRFNYFTKWNYESMDFDSSRKLPIYSWTYDFRVYMFNEKLLYGIVSEYGRGSRKKDMNSLIRYESIYIPYHVKTSKDPSPNMYTFGFQKLFVWYSLASRSCGKQPFNFFKLRINTVIVSLVNFITAGGSEILWST